MEGQNGLHDGSIDVSLASPRKLSHDSSQGLSNGSIARRKHTVPESDSDLSEAETIISSPVKNKYLDPQTRSSAVSSPSRDTSIQPTSTVLDKKTDEHSVSESAESSESGEGKARGYARKKRRKHEDSLPRSDNDSAARHADWHKHGSVKKRTGKDANGRGKLQRACDKGHYEDAKNLIQEGADVNAQDYAGNTPLHEAALNGHDRIVEMLLQNHARVDIRSGPDDLDTPLIDASANGNIQSVKILLRYGADPRLRNAHGLDALDSVREDLDNHKEISDTLREALADARKHKSQCDGSNSPTSNNLIRQESPSSSRHASRRRGVRAQTTREDLLWIDLTSRSGRELVYQRAAEGDMEYVGSFLEGGWKPDADILALAARHGHADLLGLLLAFGAPVNGINENGETALLSAAGRRRPDILKLLLESGADPFAKDTQGKNSLDIARERIGSDVEEVKVLLQAMDLGKIKVESTDHDRTTTTTATNGTEVSKERHSPLPSIEKPIKREQDSRDNSKASVRPPKSDINLETKRKKTLTSSSDQHTRQPKLHKAKDKPEKTLPICSPTEESASPDEVKGWDSSPNGNRKQVKQNSQGRFVDSERAKKKIALSSSDTKESSKDEEPKPSKVLGSTSESQAPLSRRTSGESLVNAQSHQKLPVRLDKIEKSHSPLVSHKIFKQPHFAVRVGTNITNARVVKDKVGSIDDNAKSTSPEEVSSELKDKSSLLEPDSKTNGVEATVIQNVEQPEKEVNKEDSTSSVEHASSDGFGDQGKPTDSHQEGDENLVTIFGPLYIIRLPKYYSTKRPDKTISEKFETPDEYITDLQLNLVIKNFKEEIGSALDSVERVVCRKEDQLKLWTPLSSCMLERIPRFSSVPVETLLRQRHEKAEVLKSRFMQQTVSFMKLDDVLEDLSHACSSAYAALKYQPKVEIDLNYVYGSVPNVLPSKGNDDLVLGKIVGAGTLVRQQIGSIDVEKLPLKVRIKLSRLSSSTQGH